MKSTSRRRRNWRGPPLAAAVLIAASAIAWAHGGSSHLRGKVTAAERAAFAAARPGFEKNCLRCHARQGKKTKAKARAHLDMTRYPFGGHHAGEAGEAVRSVLENATMPSDDPGAVTGEDLNLILAWADAFTAAHRSPAGAGTAKPDH